MLTLIVMMQPLQVLHPILVQQMVEHQLPLQASILIMLQVSLLGAYPSPALLSSAIRKLL